MRGFGIWKIDNGIYDILDEGNSSFYIVEGEDRAAVIDTGISPGQKILPLIRKYTSKPLILVLTHAHIDHWYHMDEFETVYMCHREFEVGADALRDMMADKELHPERTLDIRTDTRIELGGTALSICEVPGHTPGSVVVLDERSNRLFTGDAIGQRLWRLDANADSCPAGNLLRKPCASVKVACRSRRANVLPWRASLSNVSIHTCSVV